MKPSQVEHIYNTLLERFGLPIPPKQEQSVGAKDEGPDGKKTWKDEPLDREWSDPNVVTEAACCDQCGMMPEQMNAAHSCPMDENEAKVPTNPRQIINLIAAVQEARRSLVQVSKYTSFSNWYKGDHGKARSSLLKALRSLVVALKNSTDATSITLLQATKEYMDGVSMKNTPGGHELSQAMDSFRTSVSEQSPPISDVNGKSVDEGAKTYNPEKRTFKGKSYKKGGARWSDAKRKAYDDQVRRAEKQHADSWKVKSPKNEVGLDEKAPPGREKQVKALKKEPGVDNPYAVAWASYDKK